MKAGTLQSLWRGFGHSFALVSILTFLSFLSTCLLLRSHKGGWMVFMYEVAKGAWSARLMMTALTIEFVILSRCCYRRSQERPILRLVVSYLFVATLFCTTHAYAMIAAGDAGIIPVIPQPSDRYGGTVTAVSAGRPPRLSEMLESIWFFVIPLAPLLVLNGIPSISQKQLSQPDSGDT